MSTMLATQNPEAAQRMNDERLPLPRVGDIVDYHPRRGEVRRGRMIVPGLVVHVDQANRQLDLILMYEAAELLQQERVPEWNGNDRGWARREVSDASGELQQIRADLNAIKALLFPDGELPAPDEIDPLVTMLADIEARVVSLEKSPAASTTPGRRRPRG